jgi:hypothetical protein
MGRTCFPKGKKRKKKEKDKTYSNTVLSQPRVKTILRTVPHEAAFHFYEDLGKPTGQLATSLLDFRDKIKGAKSEHARASVLFHLKRGDFSNWIREVIRDPELAKHIREINHDSPSFGMKLCAAVETRINQLKDMVRRHTIVPEDSVVVHSLAAQSP